MRSDLRHNVVSTFSHLLPSSSKQESLGELSEADLPTPSTFCICGLLKATAHFERKTGSDIQETVPLLVAGRFGPFLLLLTSRWCGASSEDNQQKKWETNIITPLQREWF